MPGVQEGYSINVSNRYELSIFGEDEDDNDSTAELDPIETLRLLEEQRKADAELKKKAALKQKNTKKTHFKENKDSNRNVTPKNDDSGKDLKNRETANTNKNKNRRNDGERQNNNYGGDENKRPPRRRQENRRPPREGGFGENVGPGLTGEKADVPNRFNRGDGDNRRPERFRGGRGGFRGGNRGNRFGGYRNDGRDDRGKREFDRRSGSDRSGVKPTEKRDGGGQHNWGTPEIEVETENTQGLDDSNYDPEKSPEKGEKPEANGTDAETKDEKSDEEPKEPEPVEMTLDEWKALQSTSTKPNQEFKVRRPGEGENPDQWKGMKVIHKSRKDDDDKAESAKDSVKPQTKQSTIPTNFRFGDNSMRPSRGNRGRGGRRGGPRQYGNRDSYRNSHQAPPDVENENEFPTLG